MTKPIITIHNVETGEIEIREMNAEELAQLETDKVAAKAIKAEESAKANHKAALLERLGITAEEAILLLG
jgi:hypothetical protein